MQILSDEKETYRRVEEVFGPCFSAPEKLRFELVQFERREFLAMAEQPLPRLCFLFSGTMRIFATTANGAEFFVTEGPAPGFIGDVEFATGQPSAENVEARTRIVAAALPLTPENRAALGSDLLFHKFIMGQLALKMSYLGRMQRARQTMTLGERAAQYVRITAKNGVFRGVGGLADNLHCSYRTANRLMAQLLKMGVLRRAGKGVYKVEENTR